MNNELKRIWREAVVSEKQSIFRAEDEDSIFLLNVGIYL
jgi:hypothetical protein